PVAHPAPDPLPRPGDVGLLAVRQAHRLAHALLPVHALRNDRPRRDAETPRLDRLPDVDERMADDQSVFAAGAAGDGVSDAGLLRAGHEVVDEHAEATPGPGPKLVDDADEIVDAAEIFDHYALDTQVVAPYLLNQFGVVPALDVDPAGHCDPCLR